jgi:hypothetical protein
MFAVGYCNISVVSFIKHLAYFNFAVDGYNFAVVCFIK